MGRILVVQSSPTNSLGAQIAAELAAHLQGEIVLRDLMNHPVPHINPDYAQAISNRCDSPALALSEQLIVELEQTDALVIAAPMHNFSVPSTLKAWVDHVVRIDRSFGLKADGSKGGLLKDRPTYIVMTAGSLFSHPTTPQPDLFTDYMRLALKTIGIHQVKFIVLEGLVMGPEHVEKSIKTARAAIAEMPRLTENAEAVF